MYKGTREIILPRKGEYVSFEVMVECLDQAELTLGDLWDLLEQIPYSRYLN